MIIRRGYSGRALAGTAVVGASLACGAPEVRIVPPPDPGEPVVALFVDHPLGAGDVIDAQDLYGIEFPAGYLPAGSFVDPEAVVGRLVRFPMHANELVHAQYLSDPEFDDGTSNLVPRGTRGVEVPDPSGAADRLGTVDAWWRPPGAASACAVAERLFVLEAGSYPLVVATPDQALAVSVAARHPSFHLVARNPEDTTANEEAACSSP